MLVNALKNPFVFATVTCIVCSFVLSFLAEALRPLQERNAEIDTHRNILVALGIPEDPEKRLTDEEVESVFEERLRFAAVDSEGNADETMTSERLRAKEIVDKFPLYKLETDGEVKAYVIPMTGQGLWGPISAYLALEPDLNTIRGVTFSTKMETPGLGAEIAKPWFEDQFKGKKILADDGQLVAVTVVKGKAEEIMPEEIEHAVDGKSGATITCKGVTNMLERWLNVYEPYFKKVRRKGKESV